MPTRYEILPIPARPEFTRHFAAGPVTFGVEYRLLDEDVIRAEYGEDARARFGYALPDTLPARIDEDGVSVHVFGSDDGLEYLRFDCFGDFPHYHYISARERHQTVWDFDAVAHGPIVPWMLGQMRLRLPEMLARAGAGDLVEKLDAELLGRVLADVEAEVQAAAARGMPTRFAPASESAA